MRDNFETNILKKKRMIQPKPQKKRGKKAIVGVTHSQRPVSVKLPADLDETVRCLPNRSEFIRAAILEKLQREGITIREPNSLIR